MAIVTIARDAFNGAKDLAFYLSEALGYKLVTRADIIAALPEYGISEERLHRALYKQLGIMAKLDLEWTHFLVCARAALSREIDQGNLVYLGNDGGVLLHGFPTVLRLYVIGDMDHRVDVFMKRNNYGFSQREAERFIKRVDANNMEPRYRAQRSHETIAHIFAAGLRPALLKSMMERYSYWTETFDEKCQQVLDVKVKDCMHTAKREEYVRHSAPLELAVHQLVIGRHQSLLVIEGDSVVGTLTLADVLQRLRRLCQY